jgi:hypothetical protein
VRKYATNYVDVSLNQFWTGKKYLSHLLYPPEVMTSDIEVVLSNLVYFQEH